MPLPASPASGGTTFPVVQFPIYSIVQEGAVGNILNWEPLGPGGNVAQGKAIWGIYTPVALSQSDWAKIEHLETLSLPFFTTQAKANAYAGLVNQGKSSPNNFSAGDISYSTINSIFGANAGAGKGSTPAPTVANLGNLFNIGVKGLANWFFRALLVGGGLFLMIAGISKMANVDNKILQVASKVPVMPL